MWVGGPGCHSFATYLPASKYFDKHPEWYSLINEKRFRGSHDQETQLCLSNPEVRKKMVEKVRKFIKKEYAQSAKLKVPVPYIFDISQNDNRNYCRCKDCQSIVDREGGRQSGAVIDFINAVAGELAKEYPDLLFQTFAYTYSEDPPAHIKPADNVIVVLTDTSSNMVRTVASKKYNPIINWRVREWGKIAKHLKIWDYNINYVPGLQEQPFPGEYVYTDDLRFYRANRVTHIFTEHEAWFTGDVRDYKVWVYCHLVENPDLDFKQLSREFALNYYGPQAGELFLEYRQLLRDAIEKNNSTVTWVQRNFNYLDFAMIARAQALFDRGAELIGDVKELQKRWRFARISLDRATLMQHYRLLAEFRKLHPGRPYPFDIHAIRKRAYKALTGEARLRTKASELPGVLSAMEDCLEYYTPTDSSANIVPEPFLEADLSQVLEYNFEPAFTAGADLARDKNSLTGRALQIEFPNRNKDLTLENSKFPIRWGVYSDDDIKETYDGGRIKAETVTQSGYNWYKLGKIKLRSVTVLYLHGSRAAKAYIDAAYNPKFPDTMFDVWLRAKFTGPAFPHGKANEANTMWFDRVVIIKYPT